MAKPGDTVTLTVTASEPITAPSMVFLTNRVATVSGSGLTYTGSYVLATSDTEGVVPFLVSSYFDAAGNPGANASALVQSTANVTFGEWLVR